MSPRLRTFQLFMTVATALVLVVGACTVSMAAGIAGSIVSSDGTPVAAAVVTLTGTGTPRTVVSDRAGKFSLAGLPAGTYTVSASAKGYNALSGRTVQIDEGNANQLDLVLPRAQASSLTTIGIVRANGRQALSTAPGQSQDIAAAPYAQRGVTRTSDILENELSTTVQPVIGGGLNAPAVVSLRGPDPSETLVAIDGHAVNNGGTGDFDLSLLDPADLQSVQVVYGIGPSSLFGPNTLGGALNVRTLEPTAQSHVLERFTGGNFDTFGETLQATGTDDRLGYALSFHRLTSGGELSNFTIPAAPGGGAGGSQVSNALDASSTIAKLRYSLFNGAGFIGLGLRDQAVQRDISATTSFYTPSTDSYSSAAGSSVASSNAAYSLDASAPLGRANGQGVYDTNAVFRYQTSFVRQLVNGPEAGQSPYLFDDRDLIGDTTLEVDHTFRHASLALKFALTDENLDTGITTGSSFADTDSVARMPESRQRFDDDGGGGAVGLGGIALVTPESLAQTQRSVGLRYTLDPTAKLHYSFATYYSSYSTFGHSTDPRFGFVWTPSGETAVRFSAGTSFESPQLLSLVVPPANTLYTPTNGIVAIGNPNLSAERATELDAGYEHLFHINGQALHAGLDLYRTNLRDGVASFIPTLANQCAQNAAPAPIAYLPCLSYPINVANGVYEGVELHADFGLARYTTLHASYGINSVYSESAPVADNIVPGQQNLGVPLHKMGLTIERDPRGRGIGAYAGLLYEGEYNELNAPAFATLRAGIAWHLHDFDVGLNGTNLTNVYDYKFTRFNAGQPYEGLAGTSIPTNEIPLAGSQFTLSLTHHV